MTALPHIVEAQNPSSGCTYLDIPPGFSEASSAEEEQYVWWLHCIWLTGSFGFARTSQWTIERENGGWGTEQWLGSLIISKAIQTPILWFQMTSTAGLQNLFGEEKTAITSDI